MIPLKSVQLGPGWSHGLGKEGGLMRRCYFVQYFESSVSEVQIPAFLVMRSRAF